MFALLHGELVLNQGSNPLPTAPVEVGTLNMVHATPTDQVPEFPTCSGMVSPAVP